MSAMKFSIVVLVLVAALGWFIWEWGFCRFYVQPDQMAIIVAKQGKPLDPGQILARDDQMGVREAVLAEGRHFLNPVFFEWKVVPVTVIAPGKVGVVTSKIGRDLPQGEFLADPGQKGIWRRILGPGKYRLNPVGYDIKIEDAVVIPIGYAGVVTSLSGEQAPEGAFAGPNQKGVRAAILQPGLYYNNPKEFQINVVEIGVNQVSLLGRDGGAVITKNQLDTQNTAMEALQGKILQQQAEKRRDYYNSTQADGMQSLQVSSDAESGSWRSRAPSQRRVNAPAGQQQANAPAQQARQGRPGDDSTHVLNEFVSFPSRDGFEISLDMTVEFELLPGHIAWLYRNYGDLPAVVDKIIMPQILSITRNKGSEYRAKDFIVGEGREEFQKDITDSLAKTMAEKKIVTHNALIRHVAVPDQILDPIQKASLAVEQDLTNKERQNTAKKQAELNMQQGMIEQDRTKVAQETLKLKAEINADQEKQVAEIQAKTQKLVAEIDKETAGVRADRVRTLGKASADSLKLVEGERAHGAQMKIGAFGDPTAYNLWELAGGLPASLRINILHAGAGTLWTDLDKASTGDLGGAVLLNQKAAASK